MTIATTEPGLTITLVLIGVVWLLALRALVWLYRDGPRR